MSKIDFSKDMVSDSSVNVGNLDEIKDVKSFMGGVRWVLDYLREHGDEDDCEDFPHEPFVDIDSLIENSDKSDSEDCGGDDETEYPIIHDYGYRNNDRDCFYVRFSDSIVGLMQNFTLTFHRTIKVWDLSFDGEPYAPYSDKPMGLEEYNELLSFFHEFKQVVSADYYADSVGYPMLGRFLLQDKFIHSAPSDVRDAVYKLREYFMREYGVKAENNFYDAMAMLLDGLNFDKDND